MVARAFSVGIQEAGGSLSPDQPGLQSKFQDSQGYTEKPCLKTTTNLVKELFSCVIENSMKVQHTHTKLSSQNIGLLFPGEIMKREKAPMKWLHLENSLDV